MKTSRENRYQPYSFLTIDTTLSADNPLSPGKALSDSLQKWH